jgi:hypothetical protein
VEISAALHERFIPRLWGNEQRPIDQQIVIELEHLTAREMAEYEYTLNDNGIYRKMYDYNRIARKIFSITNFTVGRETIDTAEKLLAAKSRKASELLKEIIFHLFYEEPDEIDEKN